MQSAREGNKKRYCTAAAQILLVQRASIALGAAQIAGPCQRFCLALCKTKSVLRFRMQSESSYVQRALLFQARADFASAAKSFFLSWRGE
jgi:hypothetical protein